MQMASGIWGLTIRLTNGEKDFLVGQFEPASFRDILFGRRQGARGSMAASAAFQSVLTNLHWSDDLLESPYLKELKERSKISGKLSIRFTTFGYSTNKNDERFTLGTVIGAIGPYEEHEPRSFVNGRRMVPNCDANGSPVNTINFFDGLVDAEQGSVSVDLGNALPLTADLAFLKLGELQLAILVNENIPESAILDKNMFIPLGNPIPYLDCDWLYITAGIWTIPGLDQHLDLIQNRP